MKKIDQARTDWATAADPMPMLEFVGLRASERKSRLFACACIRDVWPLLTDIRSKDFVAVAEGFADGAKSEEELNAAWQAIDPSTVAQDLYAALGELAIVGRDLHPFCEEPYWNASKATEVAKAVIGLASGEENEKRRQCDFLRCQIPYLAGYLFGFTPALSSSVLTWNDGAVLRMAQSVYDERAFERLPVLADALEEAGCDHHELIRHCRSGGLHILGCWALDVALGKE